MFGYFYLIVLDYYDLYITSQKWTRYLISCHVQTESVLTWLLLCYNVYFVPKNQWLVVYLPKFHPRLGSYFFKSSVRTRFAMTWYIFPIFGLLVNYRGCKLCLNYVFVFWLDFLKRVPREIVPAAVNNYGRSWVFT